MFPSISSDILCNFYFSEDNRVYIWDIRRAKSSLMMLDQHNGDHAGEINAGTCILPLIGI